LFKKTYKEKALTGQLTQGELTYIFQPGKLGK